MLVYDELYDIFRKCHKRHCMYDVFLFSIHYWKTSISTTVEAHACSTASPTRSLSSRSYSSSCSYSCSSTMVMATTLPTCCVRCRCTRRHHGEPRAAPDLPMHVPLAEVRVHAVVHQCEDPPILGRIAVMPTSASYSCAEPHVHHLHHLPCHVPLPCPLGEQQLL